MRRVDFLNIVLLLITCLMLSSCFLWHDQNRADRGRRFPHDDEKRQNTQKQ